jgi:hypothetical protein
MSSSDEDEDYVPDGEHRAPFLVAYVGIGVADRVRCCVCNGVMLPPTAETEDRDDVAARAAGSLSLAADASSVKADPRVNKLWADMNASSQVSKEAADKTAKVGLCIESLD